MPRGGYRPGAGRPRKRPVTIYRADFGSGYRASLSAEVTASGGYRFDLRWLPAPPSLERGTALRVAFDAWVGDCYADFARQQACRRSSIAGSAS